MRSVITALAALLAAVVLGLFLAAMWAAQTYSYSEKLAGTGFLLGFGVPAASMAVWLVWDVAGAQEVER